MPRGVEVVDFSAAVAGTTVTYRARVCNNGDRDSGRFYVDVYFDRSAPPGVKDFGDQSRALTQLAPRACADVTFTRANTPPGAYR